MKCGFILPVVVFSRRGVEADAESLEEYLNYMKSRPFLVHVHETPKRVDIITDIITDVANASGGALSAVSLIVTSVA